MFRSVLRNGFARWPRAAFQQARPNSTAAPKPKGIKGLMAEYGYTALGVYFGLSLVDYPFCFLAVHQLGPERMARYQNSAKQVFGYGVPDEDFHDVYMASHSEDDKQGYYKQLLAEGLVAYGVHKLLVVVRLPATAAILPWVVKTLRGWGYQVGRVGEAIKPVKGAYDAAAKRPEFGRRVGKGEKWVQ